MPSTLNLQPSTTVPTTVIEARRGWRLFDWKEMVEYRELLYFLTWRDIKVRYKQTLFQSAV